MKPSVTALIIEDDAADAEFLREILAEESDLDCSIDLATKLSDGLTRLNENEYDLVLLDLWLPDSQGLATFDRLHSWLMHVPIVVLSGLDDETVALEAVHKGAQDYLVKSNVHGKMLSRVMRYAIERKRSQEEIRTAHEETESILRSIASILVCIHADYTVRRWNRAAEESLGLSAHDAVGKRLPDLGIQWQWPRLSTAIADCLETSCVQTLDEMGFVRGDGVSGVLSVHANFVPGNRRSGPRVLLLMNEITAQVALEEQLRHAQKLESIGQLAAGIAHEINTPTQYIADNARFLKSAFDDLGSLLELHRELVAGCGGEKTAAGIVQALEEAGERIELEYLREEIPVALRELLEGNGRVAAIVQAMKEFSHPGGGEKTSIDINHAIESTVTVARNEWKYVADVVQELDRSVPPVPCYPGELNQVLLNLIVNAAHAIAEAGAEKGTITIRTREVDGSVEIEIQDTGTGIPESIRPRIFDHFFTTKKVGQGTGQGLALAYSVIVKKHGGAITFDTEVGKGTTFFVRIPRTQEVEAT